MAPAGVAPCPLGSSEIRIRDLATGAERSLQGGGTPVGFADDRHLIVAGRKGLILDVETGERMGLDAIADPELPFRLEHALRPRGATMLGDSLIVTQEPYWQLDPVR